MGHRKKKKKRSSKPKKEQVQKVKVEKMDMEMKTAEVESPTEKTTDMSEETAEQDNQQIAKTVATNKETMKRKDLTYLWAGLAGGCVVVLLFCLIAFLKPEFRHGNYYICEDPSMLKELLTTNLSPADSTTITKAAQDEAARRKDAIEDLLEQKMIVSSEEFASNISSYYNTLIAVLSAILIILNLFGFFSWRSSANSSLEQKQRELDDAIKNIDDSLEKNLEEILRKNQVVRERLQSYLRELLEQRETLTEEEWDKLHLLLAKYEKQEVLKAIKDDNDDKNDGEIEEA